MTGGEITHIVWQDGLTYIYVSDSGFDGHWRVCRDYCCFALYDTIWWYSHKGYLSRINHITGLYDFNDLPIGNCLSCNRPSNVLEPKYI